MIMPGVCVCVYLSSCSSNVCVMYLIVAFIDTAVIFFPT